MIFVSAGHYPGKPGARNGSFVEHEEAVLWARRIAELCKARAMLVPPGILQTKVKFINDHGTGHDLAIEVHFNDAVKWVDRDKDGVQDPDELVRVGQGCETLYMPGSSVGSRFATIVQASLVDLFAPDRGVKEGWYRMDKAKGPDFFLEKTYCPAVIVEPDFVQRADLIVANREAACLHLSAALLAAEEELA